MRTKSIGIMHVNLTILRYHGLWPTYLDGKKDRFYRLKLCLVFSAVFLLWYGSTAHLINIILTKKRNVVTEFLEDVAMCLTTTGIYYVFFLFLRKRQDIANLIQELGNYEIFGKPENIEKLNSSVNFYSKLYYFYCLFGANGFFIFNQTIGAKQCRNNNSKFNRDEICGLYTHISLPFDYNFTPVYEIMATGTYLAGIYAAPLLTMYFMVFVMLQHLTCKIKHLKQMAEKIFERKDPFIQKQRLITCIRYHQYIIRLCDSFNDCFGQISFLYITLGAAVLSFTLYEYLREPSVASVIHMGVWLINITVVCAAGQQLIDESESVAVTFYSLDWIDAENSVKFMIKFVIMRSQKALSIKALSFGELSLATFMTIIKTAYQYVALMKNMT